MSYQLNDEFNLVTGIQDLNPAAACAMPATVVGGDGLLYAKDGFASYARRAKQGIVYGGPVVDVWSAAHPLITLTNPNACRPMDVLWYTGGYVNAAIGGLIKVEVQYNLNGGGWTPQFEFNPPGNVNSGSANEYIIASLEFPQLTFLTIPAGGSLTLEGRIRYTELVPSGVQSVYVIAVANTLLGVTR